MYKKDFKIENMKFNIDEVLKIAWKAGKEIMKIYEKDFDIEYKDDASPLTEADKKANEVITKGLRSLVLGIRDTNKLTPNTQYPVPNTQHLIPILSEEGKNIPFEERKEWEYFWLVDPLDGTKEFIKKNGEFTVNIALIHKNEPVLGVVYAPAIETVYFTDDKNAYKGRLEIKNFELKNLEILNPPSKIQNPKLLRVVASKSHLNEETRNFIENFKTIDNRQSTIDYEFISIGSSLKLCMVAEGEADIYPRLAPTMEWDTAAADAVVRKSGKMTYRYEGDIGYKVLGDRFKNNQTPDTQHPTPLTYNKENLLNPWFVVF